MTIDVVLPALDEAAALPWVLGRLPDGYRAIVVDNGSTDGTPEVASAHGALVVAEPRRGFGAACWAGLRAATADVVCFCDADASLDPAELPLVADPVVQGTSDLVLGARSTARIGTAGSAAPTGTARSAARTAPAPVSAEDDARAADAGGDNGAIGAGADGAARSGSAWSVHARVANRVLAGEVRRRSGLALADIGPMRAARRDGLLGLGLTDRRFGWPLEMVLRAARAGWRVDEVPVGYRPRIGRSKVTGTARGTARTVRDMHRALRADRVLARASGDG
jgi:glycosyltransferase involved in cell wall biosynthesis